MKNIVIISGGSGNDALLKGIYELYPNANVRVLVNAYDDGKSTGLCRIVTNTLGVSDIRKNHYRMYSIKYKGSINPFIHAFYNERFDFKKGDEKREILSKLSSWSMSWMNEYVERFFLNVNCDMVFNDFNIANIIYSEMYHELGYKKTNEMMCKMLDIDDFVILNSFENVTLGALTEFSCLNDEASIVDFDNNEEKIQSLIYKSDTPIILNTNAINVINDSDLLVISTGTFWSSILPTLEYGQLFKVINNSNAKKIWFMNNEEDKDSRGVGSNDFINVVANLGLKLEQFTIIENNDASPLLRQINDKYNVVYYNMGNNNGRHDGMKMAISLFSEYYGVSNIMFDKVLVDFDNTICSKNSTNDVIITGENLVEISKSKKYVIVSGNDYKTSIHPILARYFGENLYAFPNDVWADASSVKYNRGCKKDVINDNLIDLETVKKVKDSINQDFSIEVKVNDEISPTCLKIKPLTDLERKLLCSFLNNYYFHKLGVSDLKAIKAGKTTVDIVRIDNTKKSVFVNQNWGEINTIYIGDELMDYGNDYDIAMCCTMAIQVENIHETNLILKLINMLEK